MTNKFIEEVKAAVNGKWFRSSNKNKKIPKTAEEVCLEELNNATDNKPSRNK